MAIPFARPKVSKYRSVPTELDGIRFASKAEAKRYVELKLLQRAGQIANLKLQPRFPLIVNGLKVADYVGDFSYRDTARSVDVVEDIKSPASKTAVYRLKAKLMQACHGITVIEVMT